MGLKHSILRFQDITCSVQRDRWRDRGNRVTERDTSTQGGKNIVSEIPDTLIPLICAAVCITPQNQSHPGMQTVQRRKKHTVKSHKDSRAAPRFLGPRTDCVKESERISEVSVTPLGSPGNWLRLLGPSGTRESLLTNFGYKRTLSNVAC
ncbi:unnamed protein product [[Candida] boidinii]|nr:unnamed protein product [[Candida] boidinii]